MRRRSKRRPKLPSSALPEAEIFGVRKGLATGPWVFVSNRPQVYERRPRSLTPLIAVTDKEKAVFAAQSGAALLRPQA